MKNAIKNSLITLISAFMTLLGFSIIWCLLTWKRLNIDELIFELSSPLQGTGGGLIGQFIARCLVPAVIVTAATVFFGIYKKKPLVMRWWLLLSAVFGIGMAAVLFVKLDVYNYLANAGRESTFIEDNYVDAGETKLTFPEQKRNLIYIFLESMEITYSDIEDGGGFEENVIPELTQLAKENECFSSDDTLNGAYVTADTSWTMGGMFAQTTGMPLKIIVQGNAMEKEETFFPGITSLGDILQEQGYNQELLIGSDAVFGGRKLYFTTHGEYDIHDYPYAKEIGLIPNDYEVFWGYEDEKLFEYAKKDLLELSSKDEPFNLTMLTVDTHMPDGYECDRCTDKFGDNKYANVMACSSELVKEFVDWIKQQDFYDNTTVVICGDHTTMNGDFCNDIPEDYVRKTFTTFINSAVDKKRHDRILYSTMDMFPTTLASLGVEIDGDRLGLGTNLFSREKTLLERYSSKEVNTQFARHSAFMEEMSGIAGDDVKKRRRMLPDADVYVADYDESKDTILVKADNLINVPEYEKVTATLFDKDMNELGAYDMDFNPDRSYTCSIDIRALDERVGTVTVESVGKEKIQLGELTGDLSLQAGENLAGYIDLLKARNNVAVLFAGSGAFISDAPGADVIQLDKLGINEKLTGEGNKGFYAVVDSPSIAYGSDDNNVEFDGAFIENDLNYHIESDAEGECYIEVGGDRYDMDSNALSCLVYDYDLGKVIDTKSFDTMYRDEVYLPAVIDIEPLEGNKASILVRNVKNYDIWNVTVSIWDKDSSTEPISVELKQDDDDYNLFTGAADLAGIDTKNAFIEITCHDTSNMQHVYCDWNGDMGLLRSNLADYLAYVKSMKDCIILMSVHDEMGMSEDESVISALNRSGLKEFVAMADHEAYYAVIGPDGVTQAHSAEALTYEGTAGNTAIKISAKGWEAGYNSSIIVDDKECSLGENGINIVVYNTKERRIVDSTAYRFGIRGGDYKVFVR